MADKATTTITSCSVWVKEGKRTRLVAHYERGAKAKMFYCIGHNPFPCFNMLSTFSVVEDWLKANGWVRQSGGFITTHTDKEYDDNPSYYRTEIRTTRFVPFSPSK